MTENNTAVLVTAESSVDEKRKEEMKAYGYIYYEWPKNPGLGELAREVGAQAAKALTENDLFTYDAGRLLIGEIAASYELQRQIVETIVEHGFTEEVNCAIDCKPGNELVNGRYVYHTTVYVIRTNHAA